MMGTASGSRFKAERLRSRSAALAGLVVLVAVAAGLLASEAFGAPTPPTRYEQTDGRLVYAGTWSAVSGTAYSGGSLKQTGGAGSVTIRFDGTGLDLIAKQSISSGIAKVTLDNQAPVLVDLYSWHTRYRQRVWSTGTLSSGPHTVRIEYTGIKHDRARGTIVNIDAIDVIGGLSSTTLTTLPPATTTTTVRATTTTTLPPATTTTTLPPATRVFNVMDYGAHRDGVTDDAPHVQAAVDAAAAAGGGTVYMPAGTYYFHAPRTVNPDCGGNVELKNGVYVKGDGQGLTVVVADYNNVHPFAASQKSRIGVSYLTVQNKGTGQDGLKIYACSQVTVDHVTAYGSYNGIALYGCNDSTISNCIAYNVTNVGFHASENTLGLTNPDGKYCDNVVVSDSEAYGCGTRGFGSAGQIPSAAHPRRCNNVTFIRCNGHNNGNNFFFTYASNITMTDCTATDGSNKNVRIGGVETALLRGTTYGGTGGTTAFVVTSASDPTQYAVYGPSTAITQEPR